MHGFLSWQIQDILEILILQTMHISRTKPLADCPYFPWMWELDIVVAEFAKFVSSVIPSEIFQKTFLHCFPVHH